MYILKVFCRIFVITKMFCRSHVKIFITISNMTVLFIFVFCSQDQHVQDSPHLCCIYITNTRWEEKFQTRVLKFADIMHNGYQFKSGLLHQIQIIITHRHNSVHFDQWFITEKAWASRPDKGCILMCTISSNKLKLPRAVWALVLKKYDGPYFWGQKCAFF